MSSSAVLPLLCNASTQTTQDERVHSLAGRHSELALAAGRRLRGSLTGSCNHADAARREVVCLQGQASFNDLAYCSFDLFIFIQEAKTSILTLHQELLFLYVTCKVLPAP